MLNAEAEQLQNLFTILLIDDRCRVEACGSRITCNPIPRGADHDYLVEVLRPANELGYQVAEAIHVERVSKTHETISAHGFELEGGEGYHQPAPNEFGFKSYRRGDINLLVTSSHDFATKHRNATAICTYFNVAAKKTRIAVFGALLYGHPFEKNL